MESIIKHYQVAHVGFSLSYPDSSQDMMAVLLEAYQAFECDEQVASAALTSFSLTLNESGEELRKPAGFKEECRQDEEGQLIISGSLGEKQKAFLMAMTDMKDNVAILGNTALMGINDQYIVNQRVGLLRPKNDYNISYPFIYILTNSTDFLTDLRKRANSGVQVNLSSTEIKNSEVVIATKDINSKFDNIVKPFFEKIFINNMENTRLIQLRDTLLPKLMSGEIDVSNVDISTDKLSFSCLNVLIEF